MRFVKLMAGAAALACSGLAGQAQAAKVFTINASITPEMMVNGGFFLDLPPSPGDGSFSRGFTFRFSRPVTGTVTILPWGWYDYTQWDGEVIPGNNLAYEFITGLSGQQSGVVHYTETVRHSSLNSGSYYKARTEHFINAGLGVTDLDIDRPVDFTISGFAAVPEPATWALIILGFGTVGFAMRRRAVSLRHEARAV